MHSNPITHVITCRILMCGFSWNNMPESSCTSTRVENENNIRTLASTFPSRRKIERESKYTQRRETYGRGKGTILLKWKLWVCAFARMVKKGLSDDDGSSETCTTTVVFRVTNRKRKPQGFLVFLPMWFNSTYSHCLRYLGRNKTLHCASQLTKLHMHVNGTKVFGTGIEEKTCRKQFLCLVSNYLYMREKNANCSWLLVQSFKWILLNLVSN